MKRKGGGGEGDPPGIWPSLFRDDADDDADDAADDDAADDDLLLLLLQQYNIWGG